MKLTWHIVLNDLRRLWRPLVLWTILLAAKIGLGLVLFSSGTGGSTWFERVSVTVNLISVLEVLVGYVLVAWLIHGDLPTGTTAFWMTRPLSGRRLLAAKLLGLAVIFGAVPLTVTVPWWLTCGYGARDLMLAAAETLLAHGIVVAFALPLAVLTNEFSRYLMWTLVLITALFGASLTMIIVPGMGPNPSASAGLIATRGWLALGLFLVGGGVAAMQQFCARRLFRSIATLGAAAVVALVTLNYWPMDLSGRATVPIEQPGPHAAGVSLALRSVGTNKPRQGEDAELFLSLKLQGVPPDFVLVDGHAVHQWRWDAGMTIERSGWIAGSSVYVPAMRALGLTPKKPNAEYEAYLAERRRQRGLPAQRTTEPGVQTTRVKVPPSMAARMGREPPSYLLRARFTAYRPEVVDERLPRVEERLLGEQEQTRVAWVERERERLNLVVVERRPLLLWDVGLVDGVPGFLAKWGGWQVQPKYFLVNRNRGNATESSGRGWHAARVGTVGILWRKMTFYSAQDYRGEGRWVPQAGWLDGAKLAKVVFREEGRFTTELRVAHFEIGKTAAPEDGR